ncbi:MAG: hypothetical protein P8Y70_14555 [Candidatus Lokiarchaeota archaeon]
MTKEIPPPICYICKNNYKDEIYNLYYCFCDAAVCENCINSVKRSDSMWVCPKCNGKNDLKANLFE